MAALNHIHLVTLKDRASFDSLATHPLQSWSWGEFREKLGQKVVRLGEFKGKKLTAVIQMTIHQIPHTPWTVGYIPRGGIPSREMIEKIREEGKRHNCIFIKFEPNVLKGQTLRPQGLTFSDGDSRVTDNELRKLDLRPGKPLFTPYTFQIDLKKPEQELLAAMKPKTRYNIRVAEKHGVTVEEDISDEAFEKFQRLTKETTTRQKFYAHDHRYRQLMWKTMRAAGIAKLLVARYKREILTTWILFFFNNVGYYPYGASSGEHREAMASNLVAWRTLQWAKAAGCHTFDFWGSLGPDPDPHDPWYGFHRFKEGYGGTLVEFVGTWDLVINPLLYQLYSAVDTARWWILRLRKQ